MLGSDGITVITDSAEVLGYNMFVKPPGITGKLQAVGGARRRAFTNLCKLVDAGKLRCSFMQSASGMCQLHVKGK